MSPSRRRLLLLTSVLLLAACASSNRPVGGAGPVGEASPVRGLASWYGGQFHGRRTASGERFDMHALTAAHRSLPFGTRVRVRSLSTGREVVVRINDRGPVKRERIIDLSQAAADALGIRRAGVSEVELLRE